MSDCCEDGKCSTCSTCPAPLCGEQRVNAEGVAYACRRPWCHDGGHHPNPCGHDGCTGLECLREPEPMTMDQARADLAKGILKFLNARMANAHAAIEKLPIESVRERNDHAVRGLAANELALQMAQALARLERPRILRPERSVKVVR